MEEDKRFSPDLEPVPPHPDRDLDRIARLTADVFAQGQYVDGFRDNYIGNSHYDWNTSRLIWDSDTLVHHWGVWGYRMRLESLELKVGGIGAVATHEDYRKQGLMHRAARASFDAMYQDGYDLTILRGRHYVKIGYARAWNYVNTRVKPEQLPAQEVRQPYQVLGAERVPEMDRLYNQAYANYPGTAIRPTYHNKHPDDMGVYAWFDTGGKLDGYVRAMPDEEEPKTLQCLEAVGDPLQGLAVMGELFKKGGYEKLTFFTLPHLHPMLQILRRGACIVEDRYFDISGWRVRIINLRSTLDKLVPLFEKRLAASQFAGWQGSLHLDAGEQKATLRIDKGRVGINDDASGEHRITGGWDIARFLIGSDEPEEIIRQVDMACSGAAIPLARVLFPNLHPMLSHWDEF
jgi:hypothetical protein